MALCTILTEAADELWAEDGIALVVEDCVEPVGPVVEQISSGQGGGRDTARGHHELSAEAKRLIERVLSADKQKPVMEAKAQVEILQPEMFSDAELQMIAILLSEL